MLGFGKKTDGAKRRKSAKHPKAGSLYFQKGINHRLIGGTARVDEAVARGQGCSWRNCRRLPAAECRFDFISPPESIRMTPGMAVTRNLFLCDLHTAQWVERHGAHIPEMITQAAQNPQQFKWVGQVEMLRKKRAARYEAIHPHDVVEGQEPTVVLTDEASTVTTLLEFGDGTMVDLQLPLKVAQELIAKGKANGDAGPSLLERLRSRITYGWHG